MRWMKIMDQKAETLIIGGGAIGICCAYYLNALGKEVALVEKDDVCSGSSYGNAGLIVPSHSMPLAAPGVLWQGFKWMFDPQSPFYIKPRLQRDLLSWLWRFRGACSRAHVRRAVPVMRDLGIASRQLYDELAGLQDMDFGFTPTGKLDIYNTPKGFEAAVEETRLLQQYGVELKILEPAELAPFFPGMQTAAVGGIFCPQDGWLVPDQFVHQLARHVERQGVRMLTAVEVLGFESAGRTVMRVKTTRGDLSVKEVILAGGCWSAQLMRELKIRLLLEPAKGYSITYKRPAVCPTIPLILDEAAIAVTPMSDKLRFAGTLELAGFDLSINRRRVQAIIDAVPAYLPELDCGALELVEIWRGLRPWTPDGLPYLGRPAGYDNVIVATGHGTLGISLAPITGKIAALLATGKKAPLDLSALSLERFD